MTQCWRSRHFAVDPIDANTDDHLSSVQIINNPSTGGGFGAGVAFAGDVNNDGRGDVGQQHRSTAEGGTNAGSAFLSFLRCRLIDGPHSQ